MRSNYPKPVKQKIKQTETLYDINTRLLSKAPPATEEEIENFKKLIDDYCIEQQNHYYMLLNKKDNYYTVFHVNGMSNEKISFVLMECLKPWGAFYSGYIDEIGGIEIWTKLDEEFKYFKFFPYDLGVEEVMI